MSSFHCRASFARHAVPGLALPAAVRLGHRTYTAPQSPPSTAAQTPAFRSAVKLIDIDVLVTDKDGHFVKDLTKVLNIPVLDDLEVVLLVEN